MGTRDQNKRWYAKKIKDPLWVEKERERQRAWYHNHKDKAQVYRIENKDRIGAYYRKKYLLNRQEVINRSKLWSEVNRQKSNSIKYAWMQRNPEKLRSYWMARHARHLMAKPKWVRIGDLHVFYFKARMLTRLTGIKYEVDHIWPLRGIGFCGLHVPWNLRVITKHENVVKNNRTPQLTGA